MRGLSCVKSSPRNLVFTSYDCTVHNIQDAKAPPASRCHLDCSLHGACDEDTGVCVCDDGWNGDYACSLEVEELLVSYGNWHRQLQNPNSHQCINNKK